MYRAQRRASPLRSISSYFCLGSGTRFADGTLFFLHSELFPDSAAVFVVAAAVTGGPPKEDLS